MNGDRKTLVSSTWIPAGVSILVFAAGLLVAAFRDRTAIGEQRTRIEEQNRQQNMRIDDLTKANESLSGRISVIRTHQMSNEYLIDSHSMELEEMERLLKIRVTVHMHAQARQEQQP